MIRLGSFLIDFLTVLQRIVVSASTKQEQWNNCLDVLTLRHNQKYKIGETIWSQFCIGAHFAFIVLSLLLSLFKKFLLKKISSTNYENIVIKHTFGKQNLYRIVS